MGWLNGDLDRWMFTIKLVPFSTKKLRFLDVGAAPGCLTRMVRQLFGYEVYGLDSSNIIWADGRLSFEKYVDMMKKSGVTIKNCDLDKDLFPFADETFDVILFTEVIEHLHKPLHALNEIHRVLKTKGKLILSTPNLIRTTNSLRAILRKPKKTHGVKEYTPKELKKLLEDANFKIANVIFSDWSERKFLKKLRTTAPKPSLFYFISTVVKFGLVQVIPSLSSYVFIDAYTK
jgi:2-polyprenyl-3-methyl-5-hydroxy-6-metoxy-1,4-benzoquinol methylase